MEKNKRQKLSAAVKSIERVVALLTKTITQTKTNIVTLTQQIENLISQHNRDIAQLTTINYQCLSSMHNIIIATLPYIVMPSQNHEDLAQMAYELLRTIYQLPLRKPPKYKGSRDHNSVNIITHYCYFMK